MVKLNVKDFPRPPLCERVQRRLRVEWKGEVVADTREGWWVLETYGAPTYYIPPKDIKGALSPSSARQTVCEWKGLATYLDLKHPKTAKVAKAVAWRYEQPTNPFRGVQNYVSFYAGREVDCFVDDEHVKAQPGSFYGGWVTDDITGPIKGGPGTLGW